MIADRLRTNIRGFYDYFERASIGNNWNVDNLASATITDGKLVTEGNLDTWGTDVGAKYTGSLSLDGDFVIEANLEWVARTYDLAIIVVVLFDSSDNALAYAGIRDPQAGNSPGFSCGVSGGASWHSGSGTRSASGATTIKLERSGNTLYFYEDGNLRLSDTMTNTVDYIILTNERYLTYHGKTAKWDYVTIRW